MAEGWISAKMTESPRERSGHVLMLPYLAKGHLIPFTALAQTLSDRTSFIKITLISTPVNVQILRSLLPPNTPICFAELPFRSTDHGLPPGVETTSSAPRHVVRDLLRASGSLRPDVEHLVGAISRRDGKPPLCVISDVAWGWTLEIAKKFGTQHYIFNVAAAMASRGWTGPLAASWMPPTLLEQFCLSRETDGVLFNTVEALEAEALDDLRRNVWRRVWAIGPLLLSSSHSSSSSPSQTLLQWLDRRPKKSVLYVCFGSEVLIPPQNITELAKGLEASGKSFIWVIRAPIGFDIQDDEDFSSVEWLPEGFQERVTREKDQGLLVKQWAPQMEILSHESTGAFFSHCGWNSAVESLREGLPIIAWPLDFEQPLNSRFLEEELGVAVEVARGADAEIRGSEVERVIRLVMDGDSEKGAEMRRKAKKIREEITLAGTSKGSSIRAIDDFIHTLESNHQCCTSD
ncbi:hypothetical protein H6P81_019417 [Aristolochia fimbriata]|uniref:Glycosyltransferase n=1 Tax=Aristolochia fimbriata TaxID=158543 RepID=A0AAV7DRR8_ARIFI|nr:hypothetical protein H6P81_019417 [Aristolochia fimbriata]